MIELNKKTMAIAILVSAALGYGTALYTEPEKVVVKVDTVIKEVQVEKKDQSTTRTEITKPDGTKIIQEHTETKSENISNSTKNVKIDDKVTNEKPNWMISGTVGVRMDDPEIPIYGISVQRRILGPVFVGVYGNSDRSGGISVGMEF